ncbi:hypothetical protein [Proteiniborus sp. MB09-C3]|uniref:hypothetical protein n=1 Tax=Proteiniborus sp. MB09-C3 TaxID=3050072 RepID=UPI002553F90E|nr:hypothetical protein [Proteiniborus sp. MB09-C3]WIV12045.1 hypothetical protein QO263_18415 [Proteiniborus sp. MB09-C3]
MKVYILDKVLEYSNDKSIIDGLFQKIDSILEKSDYYFSHLVIDDLEIYEDYHDYFLDNIRSIREVNVVSSTLKELAENIMITTIDYFNRAIPELNILSNEFYKTPTEQSWDKFSDLLEGIAWIIDSFASIDTNERLKDIVSSYEDWNYYAKDIYTLQELIEELEEILRNQDLISIADILSYELTPLFNGMKEKLEGLVSKGDN